MFRGGLVYTGAHDARASNTAACLALSSILQSSYGPMGLDKLIISEYGDTIITNHGYTILRMLEVEHPVAQVLVDIARQQHQEVGDGSSMVVILAAELVRRANVLIGTRRVHPTTVVAGYRRAMKECVTYLKHVLAMSSEKMGQEVAFEAARMCLCSKSLGGIGGVGFLSSANPGPSSVTTAPASSTNLVVTSPKGNLSKMASGTPQPSTPSKNTSGILQPKNAPRPTSSSVSLAPTLPNTTTSVKPVNNTAMAATLNHASGGATPTKLSGPGQMSRGSSSLSTSASMQLSVTNISSSTATLHSTIATATVATANITASTYALQAHALTHLNAAGSPVDFFAKLAVDAVLKSKSKTKDQYQLDHVHILKAQGKSIRESSMIIGHVLNYPRARSTMALRLGPVKIACFDFGLKRGRLASLSNVSVACEKVSFLSKMEKQDAAWLKSRVSMIAKSGANLVLLSKGADDTAIKYFCDAGVVVTRRVSLKDMKLAARATGATIQSSLADMSGEESMDYACLGSAEELVVETIHDREVIVLRGCKSASSNTILLRGPNESSLDELARSFREAMEVVKRILETGNFVSGAGSVETALSVHLEKLSMVMNSREMLGINEFSEALLFLPKLLALNAGLDALDLVAKLRAVHFASQQQAKYAHCRTFGIDLVECKVRDALKSGVVEPLVAKLKAIQLATEAAITIIRIDDNIRTKKDNSGDQQDAW